MTTSQPVLHRPAVWTAGDWNAFFGFGTNILVNMLVLTGLLRFVLKMPDSLVFGRILPALGMMMCLSTLYYAWLAYRLAKTTGRSDVCALPSGVSVPHMFIVTFVIMLPISVQTHDPVQGWEAGLVWVFFQSFILMIGGLIAPFIRKITPPAALLGTLAGVSITFGALGVAGASAAALGFDKLANVGVLYPGLQTLGGGAVLTGLVLAAIGANVIDKKFVHAAAFALAGAVLTFFGFMHGEAVGIAVTPTVAVAYGIVAVFLYGLSRYPALAPALTGPGEIMAATPAE
jgi:hypothetical protein